MSTLRFAEPGVRIRVSQFLPAAVQFVHTHECFRRHSQPQLIPVDEVLNRGEPVGFALGVDILLKQGFAVRAETVEYFLSSPTAKFRTFPYGEFVSKACTSGDMFPYANSSNILAIVSSLSIILPGIACRNLRRMVYHLRRICLRAMPVGGKRCVSC